MRWLLISHLIKTYAVCKFSYFRFWYLKSPIKNMAGVTITAPNSARVKTSCMCFEGGMWDLIVLIPDRCFSTYCKVRQRPARLWFQWVGMGAVRAMLSILFPCLWETARYELKHCFIGILTHCILVHSSTVICWTGPFVILEVSGLFCRAFILLFKSSSQKF